MNLSGPLLLIALLTTGGCSGPDPDTTAPDTPIGIVTSAGDGTVTVTWLAVSAGDLAGYVIYWGTKTGNYDSQVRIDNVGLTAYVVDSLPPATYYFAATAFNSAGVESGYSNEVVRKVVVN